MFKYLQSVLWEIIQPSDTNTETVREMSSQESSFSWYLEHHKANMISKRPHSSTKRFQTHTVFILLTCSVYKWRRPSVPHLQISSVWCGKPCPLYCSESSVCRSTGSRDSLVTSVHTQTHRAVQSVSHGQHVLTTGPFSSESSSSSRVTDDCSTGLKMTVERICWPENSGKLNRWM